MSSTKTALGRRALTCLAGAAATVALTCAMGAVLPGALAEEAAQDSEMVMTLEEYSAEFDAYQWADDFPLEYNSWWQSTYPNTNGEQPGYTWDEKMGKPDAWVAALKSGNARAVGCLSCHSTSFVALYDKYGQDMTAVDFDQIKVEANQGITCYSCHGDTPGEMVPSKAFIVEAAQAGGIETSADNMVCAQCHALPGRAWVEELGSQAEDDAYGIMGSTDVADWSSLNAGTNADDVYQWFLDMGVKNPKIVVGEMEFNQYYGSTMDMAGATCADCHMEDVVTEDGQQYTRHAWQGGNVNPAIYENCAECHAGVSAEDMQAHVIEIQSAYQVRRAQTENLVKAAQSAIELSDADEATISEATDLWFQAKFLYMYGQDSSEGIHGIGNTNTNYCWDECADICAQIVAMVA